MSTPDLGTKPCKHSDESEGDSVAILLKHSENRGRTIKWHIQRRQGLGLTQTNAKLREEYLPLYLRDTAIMVERISLYLETFVEPQIKNGKVGNVVGNVTFVMFGGTRDLLPLMKICTTEPHFKVSFQGNDGGFCASMYSMSALVNSNPTWSAYVQQSLSQVELFWQYRKSTGLVITVKADAAEDWMESYPNWDWYGDVEFDEWSRRVGLLVAKQVWDFHLQLCVVVEEQDD